MSNSRQHQGHFARKRFGQNFLVDHGVIDSIVTTIGPRAASEWSRSAPGSAR